jgi:hypothetical protein
MPHRYICTVLEEMRTAIKVHRPDLVIGLIEEAQTLVNRMECQLNEYSDIGYELERGHDLRIKLRELDKQATMIEDQLDGME